MSDYRAAWAQLASDIDEAIARGAGLPAHLASAGPQCEQVYVGQRCPRRACVRIWMTQWLGVPAGPTEVATDACKRCADVIVNLGGGPPANYLRHRAI